MKHLAIIPDGNRRWAKLNKLEAFFGHKKGVDAVRSAITVCIKNGIQFLSFYTFSLENVRRSEIEKTYLFNLLSAEFSAQLPELIKEGVRICFLGDRSLFPAHILKSIQEMENKTKHLTRLQLNLLFFYGGQQEMVEAVKKIAEKIQRGEVSADTISLETIQSSLWTSGIPDPELIIRTGKVARLSNFLLFQAAYSEFIFLDSLWPEATETMLQDCINKFTGIQRNFGV